MKQSKEFDLLMKLSTEGKTTSEQIDVLKKYDEIVSKIDDENELDMAGDIYEGLMLSIDPDDPEYIDFALS